MPKKKLVADQLEGLLDCSICLERYEEPKMLVCTHEYCKLCIQHLAQFQNDGSAVIKCPMRCKQETKLNNNETVNDLPTSHNFKNLLNALAEDDEVVNERMVQCSFHKKCKKKPVSVYCCGSIMCEVCYGKHVSSNDNNNDNNSSNSNNNNNNNDNNKSKKNKGGKKSNKKSNNKNNSSKGILSENINNDENKENINSGNNSNDNKNDNMEETKNNSCKEKSSHDKVSLGFNRTESKLMVVCEDHRAFCSSLCQEKKFLCTYCEHRCPEHKKHNKISVEEEVKLLRETLQTELNVRQRIMKYKEATKESNKRLKEELKEVIRQRKEECMKRYADFLEDEEIRLTKEFDKRCEAHLKEEYENDYDIFPPEYCENILQKHDVELFLQRDEIWKEIEGNSRFDFLATLLVYFEEDEDFLSTKPMGDIKSRFYGCIYYCEEPHTTCPFALEERPEGDLNDIEAELSDDVYNVNASLGLKVRGNQFFKKHQYRKAKDCYSKAIQFCPEGSPELAVFYQNRAAASEELGDVSDSLDDCTSALEENPRYVKALQRRCRLREKEGYLQGAYSDAVTARYLDEPENKHKYRDDEIGTAMGRKLAEEFLKKRNNRHFWLPPSKRTLREVLTEDNHDLYHIKIISKSKEDTLYRDIMKHLDSEQYDKIIPLCAEVIKLNGKHKFRALSLRRNISLCKHDADQASADFHEIIENMDIDEEEEDRRDSEDDHVERKANSRTIDQDDKRLRSDAMIKRGCLKICTGDGTNFHSEYMCLNMLSMTMMSSDKERASMYHHLANFCAHFIAAPYTLVEHYEKATKLDPTFLAPRMRLSDVLFNVANHFNDAATFERTENVCREMIRLFPEDYRSWYKYGQFLWKSGRYDEALKMTQKAIDLGPNMSLPYIFKARIHLSKGDVKGAAELCEKALSVDDQCYEALGFYGKVKEEMGEYEEAASLVERSIENAYRAVEFLSPWIKSMERDKVRAKILKEHEGCGDFQ